MMFLFRIAFNVLCEGHARSVLEIDGASVKGVSLRHRDRDRDRDRPAPQSKNRTASDRFTPFRPYISCCSFCLLSSLRALLGGQGGLREGAPGTQGNGVEDVGGRKAAPEGRR